MEPEVKSVRTSGSTVEVVFTDGHRATFFENAGGFHTPTNVERIWLGSGNKIVATFNSPRQHPVSRRPFGMAQLVQGYTTRGVAQYWRAAYDYVAAGFRNGQLADAWNIVYLSRRDIEELEAGGWSAS